LACAKPAQQGCVVIARGPFVGAFEVHFHVTFLALVCSPRAEAFYALMIVGLRIHAILAQHGRVVIARHRSAAGIGVHPSFTFSASACSPILPAAPAAVCRGGGDQTAAASFFLQRLFLGGGIRQPVE